MNFHSTCENQFDNFLTRLLLFSKLSHADFINLNLKILRVWILDFMTHKSKYIRTFYAKASENFVSEIIYIFIVSRTIVYRSKEVPIIGKDCSLFLFTYNANKTLVLKCEWVIFLFWGSKMKNYSDILAWKSIVVRNLGELKEKYCK